MPKLGELRRRAVVRIHDGRSQELAPARGPLQAFYFGVDDALFGCYDVPETEPCRDVGVVVCPPLGHEYASAHRALRQLALRFVAKGFPTLRFDYFGTGDSGGESAEASMARCRVDVEAAIAELGRRAQCAKFVLVGFRLGATLAATVASGRRDLAAVVLWDPILDGVRYRGELAAMQREWAASHGSPVHLEPDEVLGFRWAGRLEEELMAVDLTSGPSLAGRVLVVDTSSDDLVSSYATRLRDGGADVTHDRFEASIRLDEPERVRVPGKLVTSIAGWVSEL